MSTDLLQVVMDFSIKSGFQPNFSRPLKCAALQPSIDLGFSEINPFHILSLLS